MTSQDDFLRKWHYAVERDFAKDGVPAYWAPSHPASWGTEHSSVTFDSKLSAASFSPDEKYLAVAAGRNVHVYETTTLTRVELIRTTGSTVASIEWQPTQANKKKDGYRLLAGVSQQLGVVRSSMVMTWKLGTNGEIDMLQRTSGQIADEQTADIHYGTPSHAGLSSAINTSALAGSAAADVVNLLHGRYHLPEDPSTSAALAAGFQKVLEEVAYQQDIGAKWEFATSGATYSPEADAFSHDGRYILVDTHRPGDSGRQLAAKDYCDVWDVAERRQRARLAADVQFDTIVWAGWSPDDKTVATSCWDGTVALWDVGDLDKITLKHMLGPSRGQNWTAAFSPDSSMIAHGTGSHEHVVRIWEVESGAHVLSVANMPAWSRTLAWSPDSASLSAGMMMGELCVVDVPARRVTQWWKLRGDNELLSWVELRGMRSIDGGRKLLFATGADCGVEVYDFEKNEKWRVAPTPADVGRMRDGWAPMPGLWWNARRQLLTLGKDNTLRFWKVD